MTDSEKVKAAREIINDGPNADNYTKLQVVDALGDLLSVIDKGKGEPVVEFTLRRDGYSFDARPQNESAGIAFKSDCDEGYYNPEWVDSLYQRIPQEGE